MITVASAITWDEALRGFILHKEAVRSATTARWYKAYCTNPVSWAQSQNISLGSFTKRYLDEYLAFRSRAGKSATTLHHDALTARVFTEGSMTLLAAHLLAAHGHGVD